MHTLVINFGEQIKLRVESNTEYNKVSPGVLVPILARYFADEKHQYHCSILERIMFRYANAHLLDTDYHLNQATKSTASDGDKWEITYHIRELMYSHYDTETIVKTCNEFTATCKWLEWLCTDHLNKTVDTKSKL